MKQRLFLFIGLVAAISVGAAVSQDKAQSIINNIGKSITNGIPSILYRVP